MNSGAEDQKKLNELHSNLARLSGIGANARQTLWHRVNLLRSRLMITAILLGVFATALTLVLLCRPAWLGVDDYHPNRVLGVVWFGLLGGL